MSVCPFVVITIASERKKLRTSNFAQRLLLPKMNGLYRFTGSGNSHINQIGILGSWALGTSDGQQIWYFKIIK